MALQQEWNIKSRAHQCAVTERAFADGEAFVSRLLIDDIGDYQREDISESAWTPDMRDGALSVWHSVFREPPPPEEEPLKPETTEDLLRSLMQGDDPANIASMFILGMQLERKRLLVQRDKQRRPDGMLIRVYEHRHSGDIFLIPDPELRLDEIADVQQQVAVKLGWIEAEPESDPGSETGDESESGADPAEAPIPSPAKESNEAHA